MQWPSLSFTMEREVPIPRTNVWELLSNTEIRKAGAGGAGRDRQYRFAVQ
jgi:hypothetical protein